MKMTYRLLGGYQIAGGVCTLATLGPEMLARDPGPMAALIVFSALAIVAGVAMWRENPAGWRLAYANQLVQLVGLFFPWFTFSVIHGASATVMGRYFAKTDFAESTINLTANITLGSSDCAVRLGKVLEGADDYGVSLNFLALGVLLYVFFVRKKAYRTIV